MMMMFLLIVVVKKFFPRRSLLAGAGPSTMLDFQLPLCSIVPLASASRSRRRINLPPWETTPSQRFPISPSPHPPPPLLSI